MQPVQTMPMIPAIPATDVEQPTDAAVRFRPPADTVQMDWKRLRDHLHAHGHVLSLEAEPRQFSGGLANLNYLIEFDGEPCVLRRPPLGTLPAGAHDMGREHRVLSGLWRHYPLAPRSLHYCDDPSVLGAHFLIMEYRPGISIGSAMPPGADDGTAQHLGGVLVDLLVTLHAVDPHAPELASLGKPDGFIARAIDGWSRRADIAAGHYPDKQPLIAYLTHWLRTHRVPDVAPTMLHCDFKLDNVLLDPVTLSPRAVLDWDMATRGHPLFDVATMLSYWTEPGDPEEIRALHQMPTATAAFPSRREVIDAYARRTGRDVSDFPFHRVLGMFKLGVVFLQLHTRYLSGHTRDEKYRGFGHIGWSILDFTHDIIHGRAF